MKRLLIVAGCILMSNQAYAIKKCQDSDGKWHYGDFAVRECQNSKVTTLSRSGTIKEEQEAPKSAEEKQAEQEALEAEKAEKQRVKIAELERSRILSIYETEADIDRQRDNQLNSVQSNIDVHDSYLKTMDKRIARQEIQLKEATNKNKKKKISKSLKTSKENVKAYTEQLAKLKKQREEIVSKFEKEKELYRELKGESGQ